jgi:hypothetical protein
MKYYGSEYDKYNLEQNSSGTAAENDLLAGIKAGAWLSSDLLLYLGADHFNDLNENALMNYSDLHLTGQYQKHVNYIHYFRQDISLGYSDLDEDLPYYIRSHSRLSSRFTPDWTLLNILEYEGWLDEQQEYYLGNSWFKTIIRRNLSVSPGNELSYLQAAAQCEIDNEIGFTQLAGRYYLNRLMISASGKYYFGKNRWLDQQINAGLGWSFPETNLRLGYEGELTLGDEEEGSNLQTIFLEYSF